MRWKPSGKVWRRNSATWEHRCLGRCSATTHRRSADANSNSSAGGVSTLHSVGIGLSSNQAEVILTKQLSLIRRPDAPTKHEISGLEPDASGLFIVGAERKISHGRTGK